MREQSRLDFMKPQQLCLKLNALTAKTTEPAGDQQSGIKSIVFVFVQPNNRRGKQAAGHSHRHRM